MTAELETGSPAPASWWERAIWPGWLPKRARLPLIAQIAGAFALVTAIAMPRGAAVTQAPATPPPSASKPVPSVPQPSPVPPPPAVTAAPARPAHLNLDVRHSFKSIDLSISVDGKQALQTKVEGGGKRFGVFGKRSGKNFTQSLDLPPGVRVVRVRVRSAPDKFDQTRIERFDLDSAAVASMQISADKSGLSIVAERTPAARRPRATEPAPPTPAAVLTQETLAAQVAQATLVQQAAQAAQAAQTAHAAQAAQAAQAGALAELYQSLRQILIAVAGFVASAATGFVVQEFMRSRKGAIGL